MKDKKFTWEQQYQCCSCEKTYIILNASGDEGCPYCKSGNVVKGFIDDPEDDKFHNGELTLESYKVVMHDLQCLILKDKKEAPDNKYHYNLLRTNLDDIFGFSESDITKSEDI